MPKGEAMIDHIVETCTDDLAELKMRLDQLGEQGAEIVTVLWQASRVDADQIAALEARGSFVIVARRRVESPLRIRDDPLASAPGVPTV
jgi:hypothetical protein